MEDRWFYVKRDGIDTVHRNPREECNLDDTDRERQVDEFTAEALLTRGDAKACEHCLAD